MRKNAIIIGIILVICIGGLAIAWEAFSYKNVEFKLNSDGYVVDIYNNEDQEISSVTNSGITKLKEGEYSYRVNGDTYDSKEVSFTVKDNKTFIEVEPHYSEQYLNELLEEERSSIEAILSSSYKTQNYTIQTLQLYQKGQWAAGTLTLTTDPRQLPDTYRFVLQKVNDIWTIIVPPQIAISKATYKNVPESILYSLYSED